jgi:uncharacterized membrane protein (UPF0127 family)
VNALRIEILADGPPTPLRSCGRTVAENCHRASRAPARLVGLLGTPDLGDDEALWLTRCASVHTWFLRAPIGVAFLDRGGGVLRVVDPLRRWRLASCRGAEVVVECRAGVLTRAGVAPGDLLSLAAAGGPPDLR